MRNYIAPGQSVDIAADAAYTAGQGYVVGAIFGVAANTAAEDETVTLHLTGIYEFSGEGAVGDVAFWDDAEKAVGATAPGAYAIGSVVGADAAAGTVQVRLDGTSVTAVSAG